MKANQALALLFAGFLLVLGAATARAAGTVELNSEVFEEITVTDKNGKQEKKLQALTRAVPGKEVVYVLTYRNKGDKPADKVVVRNPLPAGLLYTAGTAKGDGALVEVSVDGGKTWGDLGKLTVTNGNKTRPATPEDVTHLRWTVSAPVKPGASGKVTYRALVK